MYSLARPEAALPLLSVTEALDAQGFAWRQAHPGAALFTRTQHVLSGIVHSTCDPTRDCPSRVPHSLRSPVPRLRLCSAIVLAAFVLGACASDNSPEGPSTSRSDDGNASSSHSDGPASPTASQSTPSADPDADPTVRVQIAGERVTPNAERVDLAIGRELVFEVVSDRPGELHVHSRPEQYVPFDAGRTRSVISIETPGSVQVEEHDTSAVVAIAEVR